MLDDNNRKPICRLHFNRTQKYIGIFDEEKNETRHPISSVDDIYEYSDHLKKRLAITTENETGLEGRFFCRLPRDFQS